MDVLRLRSRIEGHNKLSETEQLSGLFFQYIFLFALYQLSSSASHCPSRLVFGQGKISRHSSQEQPQTTLCSWDLSNALSLACLLSDSCQWLAVMITLRTVQLPPKCFKKLQFSSKYLLMYVTYCLNQQPVREKGVWY